jgi:hypothetical protein
VSSAINYSYQQLFQLLFSFGPFISLKNRSYTPDIRFSFRRSLSKDYGIVSSSAPSQASHIPRRQQDHDNSITTQDNHWLNAQCHGSSSVPYVEAFILRRSGPRSCVPLHPVFGYVAPGAPVPCTPPEVRCPTSRDRGSKQGFERRAATGPAAPSHLATGHELQSAYHDIRPISKLLPDGLPSRKADWVSGAMCESCRSHATLRTCRSIA